LAIALAACGGVGGGGDRPTDDEDVRTRAHGFFGRLDATLIGEIRAVGPYPGRHDQEFGTAGRAPWQFPAGCKRRHRGPRLLRGALGVRPAPRGVRLADRFEAGIVEAGENRHADDLRTRICARYSVDRSAHHRFAAGRMNVEDRRPESRALSRRRPPCWECRGISRRQKPAAERDDGSDAFGPMCRNELEPDLEAAHMRSDGARKLQRAGQILRVQGDEDGIFESRVAHRDGVLDPDSRPGKRPNFDF
jgi:hypothetical protein